MPLCSSCRSKAEVTRTGPRRSPGLSARLLRRLGRGLSEPSSDDRDLEADEVCDECGRCGRTP